jgi:hypothetical protein
VEEVKDKVSYGAMVLCGVVVVVVVVVVLIFFCIFLVVVGGTPCFLNPEISASDIAQKNYRSIYDVFGLPCSPYSYIPNERLRMLVDTYETLSKQDVNEDVCKFEHSLRQNLKSLHTWKYSTGGSESNISDPNLSKFLSMINTRVSEDVVDTAVLKDKLPFSLVLAKNSSKPEHRIQWGDYVIIASEAKGVEHSAYQALIQGLELGGDAAVNMWRRGLSTELAVVPVVLSFSHSLCICAVYLIPDCYPVIVELSPALSYLTLEGRCCIARWGIVLAQFAVQTVGILKLSQVNRMNREMPLGLYIATEIFFKPLREYCKAGTDFPECTLDSGSRLRTNLELIMLVYNRIHVVQDASELFLFPLGVVSYPSTESMSHDTRIRHVMDTCICLHFHYHKQLVKDGCPVIVYDKLSRERGWSNDKPSEDVVNSYIECVIKAVGVLNAAGVAHMDLRPANILWCREESGTDVRIQVIDLEDAVPFGFYIRSSDTLREDTRYPVFEADERILIPAVAPHNDWFCETVASWARQSEFNEYSSYMAANFRTFEAEFFTKCM